MRRSRLVVWTGLALATFALASCTSTTSDATSVGEPRKPAASTAPSATSSTTARSVSTRAAAGPRYAVYGDSTGLAVAVGLDAWAREHPRVLRETRGFAQLGCGLIELTRDSGDGLKPYSHECTNWPERWRSAAITANAVEPTSGVIVLGPWEVTDLTFPGDTEPKRLGDPFYDEVERSALTHGVDVLLEHSPYVVILTSPYVERGRAGGRPPSANSRCRTTAAWTCGTPSFVRSSRSTRNGSASSTTQRSSTRKVLPTTLGYDPTAFT